MRFIIGIAFYLLFAGWASAETRLALVIHQQNYTGDLSPVGLAASEADQIAGALSDVGFEVTRRSNLTKQGLDDALDNFRVKLESAGPEAVGFVYYTGHGAQNPRTRDSYLLGVSTRLRASSDFARHGVNLATQRDAFGAVGAKAVFLVFDACRNTPAVPGFKANVKGLTRIAAAPEMLIAYSTSLGDLAEEGVYAPILAEEIRRSGQSAEQAFLNAQKRVAQQTEFNQRPWSNFLFYRNIFLGRASAASTMSPSAVSKADAKAAERAGNAAYNQQDYSEASLQWDLACRSGNALGCTYLGFLYEYGYGVTQDYAEAKRLYQIGCDGGHAGGCTNLGVLYQSGHGVTRDYPEARRLYQKGCDGGNAGGCTNLGILYQNGYGVTQDYAEAKRLYQIGCDGGEATGCSVLGNYLYRGLGGAEDKAEGASLLRQGCSGEYTWACNKLDEYGLSR